MSVVHQKSNQGGRHGRGSWVLHMQSVPITTDVVSSNLDQGLWFSPCPQVSSTNKTDPHNITEILLKVALNTITLTRRMTGIGYAK